jgi:hydrogenase expression/formation protein HypC
MCLAIPMRVVEIDGFNARCEAKGIERTVSLFLMQHETVATGDMVMVHVGYAIQKVTAEDAKSAWELYDEMLAAENGNEEEAGLVPLKKADDHA